MVSTRSADRYRQVIHLQTLQTKRLALGWDIEEKKRAGKKESEAYWRGTHRVWRCLAASPGEAYGFGDFRGGIFR
jgi:hypothetical protein